MRRVEVWRGGLGRSLFSPVGPPFRLRVSQHLDPAPFPHPALRTVHADFPHTALGQEPHAFAHGKLLGRSLRRISPNSSCRYRSGNRDVPRFFTLCLAHKVKNRGMSRFPDRYLHEVLGLVRLSERSRDFPWANA